MKREATLYDYNRFCRSQKDCQKCPLYGTDCSIPINDKKTLDFVNDAVLTWCDNHPLETRLDKLKKIFPNIKLDERGLPPQGCPNSFDKNYRCPSHNNCSKCYEEYWLEEMPHD